MVAPVEFPSPEFERAIAAARCLLEYVEDSPTLRPDLAETPLRFVRALEEMTHGYYQDPKEILSRRFDVVCDDMVVLRGIEFYSLCEHHILPFSGTATVAYLPNGAVVGISKLARLVECYARRLQVQERLTTQIAHTLMDELACPGAACIIRAHHLCMGCRGVRQPSTELVTSAMLGVFRDSPRARAELLGL